MARPDFTFKVMVIFSKQDDAHIVHRGVVPGSQTDRGAAVENSGDIQPGRCCKWEDAPKVLLIQMVAAHHHNSNGLTTVKVD